MLKKPKKQGLGWAYIRDRHSSAIDELKTLRDWDGIKSAIPESEHLGDYSLLALEAVAATIRELRLDRSMLAERIEILNKKSEELSTAYKNDIMALEKRIKELEDHIAEIEQRTLFLDSVEMLIPRISEIEERFERLPMEITRRMEERYGGRIDGYLKKELEGRLKEFEEKLKRDIFGVSVNLAETLSNIQQHYEELVEENARLRSTATERDELKKALVGKEREIEELKSKLVALEEMSKRVDALSRRLSEYEAKASQLALVKKHLIAITGKKDLNEALKVLKTQFVPKSELENTLKEVREMLTEMDEVRRENERLRGENEKLKEALKTLIQERLETGTPEEGEIPEGKSGASLKDGQSG